MVLYIEGRVWYIVSLMFRGDWKLFHMHEMVLLDVGRVYLLLPWLLKSAEAEQKFHRSNMLP